MSQEEFDRRLSPSIPSHFIELDGWQDDGTTWVGPIGFRGTPRLVTPRKCENATGCHKVDEVIPTGPSRRAGANLDGVGENVLASAVFTVGLDDVGEVALRISAGIRRLGSSKAASPGGRPKYVVDARREALLKR